MSPIGFRTYVTIAFQQKVFNNLFLKIRGCVFHGSSDTNQIDREIYDVHFYIKVCVVYNGNSINVLDGLKVR